MIISEALRQRWENAAPNDSFVFVKLLQQEDICIGVLETLLDIEIDHIEYLNVEDTIEEGFFSKGIRVDVYVRDEKGTVYNVEMQRRKVKGLPKRSRYYGSLIDVNRFKKSGKYKDLCDNFVIFICNYDPFGQDRCVYYFEYRDRADHELKMNDGTARLFFYTKGKDKNRLDLRLQKLLDFFDDAMPDKTTDDELLQRMTDEFFRIKSNQEMGVDYMTLDVFIDDWIDFGYEDAEAKYIPMLNEKDKELAENKAQLAENKAQLAEKDNKLAEQGGIIAEKDIEIEQLKVALKEALAKLP